jgi:hypothetical protein
MIGATLTTVAVAAAACRAIARRQPLRDITAAAIVFAVGLIIQGMTP